MANDKKRVRSREELEQLERAADWTIANWHTLGVIEDEQHGPLLPCSIRTRDQKTGGIAEKPCVLMLLDGPRVIEARKRARRYAVEIGLDSNRDEPGQDRDLVRELECFYELAYAIRDPEAPHDQMYPDGKALWQAVRVRATMHQLYAVFDQWTQMNDPGYGALDGEQIWRVLEQVGRAGNLIPLQLIGGRDQAACILLSVREALNSPNAPSAWRSPRTSSSPGEASGT